MTRRGDVAFHEHYPIVLRTCLRILDDPDDAADAAQETFRRALEHDLTVLTDPPRWLKTVARNVCRDELRRRRRAQLRCTAADDGAANPECIVVGRALVGDLLDRLTPAERRVVAARVIDDQAAPELAASLGVAPSTARVLLARGLGKLRRYLADGQTALGGVGVSVAGAVQRANRMLRWLAEPQGVAVLQGVTAAIVTVAVATLSSYPATHAPGGAAAAAPQRHTVVALGPAQPVAAQTVVHTVAPPAAGRVAASPSSGGQSTRPQQPSPPPPASSGPTGLLPTPPPGPIAKSNPPQQSPRVGPVYILVGPSPQYQEWIDGYARDVGIFATKCGLPTC